MDVPEAGPCWTYLPLELDLVHRHQRHVPPGFVGLEACLPHSLEFGDAAFVVFDRRLMAELHGSHFQTSKSPLPVALARPGPGGTPGRSLRCFSHKKWILLANELTPELVAMAHDAPAAIYLGTSFRPPHSVWLRQVASTAMPWEQALAASASRMRDPELLTFLLRLDLHKPGRWKAIRSQLPAELLPRIESLRPPKRHRYVTFDNTHIVESAEGWLHCKTGEVISDVVIRVTHVIRIRPKAKTGGLLIYAGHAIYRGHRNSVGAFDVVEEVH